MTILKMVDVSNPSGVNWLAARQYGIDIAGGYIGGDTPHVWTKAEWTTVLNCGLQPIAIYVPAQDPAHYTAANGEAEARVASLLASDLPSLPLFVVCDIERDMWDANPEGVNAYLQAWTTALASTGRSGVYAPRPAFNGWPAVPAFAWVSQWLAESGSAPGPWPTALTLAAGLAPTLGWQWAGGADIGFGTVDLSVVQLPSLPPSDPSSPDTLFTRAQIDTAWQAAQLAYKKVLGIS